MHRWVIAPRLLLLAPLLLLLIGAVALACGGEDPTPETIIETVVVPQTVEVEVTPTTAPSKSSITMVFGEEPTLLGVWVQQRLPVTT